MKSFTSLIVAGLALIAPDVHAQAQAFPEWTGSLTRRGGQQISLVTERFNDSQPTTTKSRFRVVRVRFYQRNQDLVVVTVVRAKGNPPIRSLEIFRAEGIYNYADSIGAMGEGTYRSGGLPINDGRDLTQFSFRAVITYSGTPVNSPSIEGIRSGVIGFNKRTGQVEYNRIDQRLDGIEIVTRGRTR